MTQKRYLTQVNDTIRNDSQETLFYKIPKPLDEKSACSLQQNPDFSKVNPRYFEIPDNLNQIKSIDNFPSPVKACNSPCAPIFRTSRNLELTFISQDGSKNGDSSTQINL